MACARRRALDTLKRFAFGTTLRVWATIRVEVKVAGRRYFARLATSSSVAMPATSRVNLISSPVIFPL